MRKGLSLFQLRVLIEIYFGNFNKFKFTEYAASAGSSVEGIIESINFLYVDDYIKYHPYDMDKYDITDKGKAVISEVEFLIQQT